ncbi:glycosyltransferase family 39 protein [Anabaena cylindrica FACHB-243]|uniref:Glycosyl transferase family 39 n=1 Tax=Anabaena cylindrica (strain ATCC 27899 / PCC 7122) TaxID=272123 RepID=K9ZGP3_ANACC|nr:MULTISPECIES: glycosyltransferase family 39 protein [Anabaena]AFZ58403.1 glycosyl transferase family 39 [Anabaena cylindrica PCC 7122]MBD2416999.1 glycosyltransferase family 39 protein [Anabaena cylindrica FACHB-243]MBY5280215.1 glycosyltransferase family 39 protein [Anabaena sp. CCAP 1446/1C]MBY5309343.1 glycosyltransferase family 39 protein [Anabaena sp. CCAP 1446/1C]MCM2406536.1 glycosyltransferase family 39 protein [Anabaena sp. CCAP 1446/1C]
MFYKLPLFTFIWNQIRLLLKSHFTNLLIWLLPLLLFSSGENSLMAHDEALYARRARLMFESDDWIAPWGNAHHKTPGFYWLIAIFYKLFGVSDISARIPSMIAGILSIFLIYEITKIVLHQKLAYLTSAILSVTFLWLQYCRLATPDIPMILLVLIAIYSLLQAELYPKFRPVYGFIVGASLALCFLMRSFMIVLPIIALLPYLIWENPRHRHLTNPMLFVGALVGLIPTIVWLWFNWLRYSGDSWGQLLGFVVQLGSREQNGNNILFYFWNLPLKSFPWSGFAILGLILVIRNPIPHYQLLLIGFPLILFTEISLFSTRLSHYSLCLYPFIAIFAAVGLDWLTEIYQPRKSTKIKALLRRHISYAIGILGVICALAGVAVLVAGIVDIQKYAILALISGLGCLIIPLIWIGNYNFHYKYLTASHWVNSWLIASWLSIATAGSLGLLGDFNPAFRIFFQQKPIAAILQNHPVSFVKSDDKNSVLINFYTPIHGQQVDSISQLSALSYAWIYTPEAVDISKKYRVIGTVKNYQLIQVLSF